MLNINIPSQPGQITRWNRLYGSAFALAAVEAAKTWKQGPIAIVVTDIAQADALKAEIQFYGSSRQKISFLRDWETLPYDIFSPHQDIISDRLKTLHEIQNLGAGDILMLPLNTMTQRLVPRDYINGNVLMFSSGTKLDMNTFRASLEACGYSHVAQVMEHGEYTIRGSIIDLYPTGSSVPYRFDLFDDEIESISSFDPATQRSLQKIDSIELLPAREFSINEKSIHFFREKYREKIAGDPLQSIIYKSVTDGLLPAGIEYYLPLFFEKMENVFDYLPASTLLIKADSLDEKIEEFYNNLNERYEQRRHDIERPLLPPDSLFLNKNEIDDYLKNYPAIHYSRFSSTNQQDNLAVKEPPDLKINTGQNDTASAIASFIETYHGRILFVAETPGRREVISELLRNQHIHPKSCTSWDEFINIQDRVCLTVFEIENGLRLIDPDVTVITEPQVFGMRATQKRRRKKRGIDADLLIKNLTDLNIGSPVVHLDHGVGRYLGLQKLSGLGFDTEFLTIEYAGNDKLYVPVTSLHLISRYTGASQENAPLHKLGTDYWRKAKQKAAKKASDVAAELLDIHSRRAASNGHAYDFNHDEYMSFTNGFPFEETPDQDSAIQSVIDDLKSPRPMDRIVCGDVGFGKTEVAMRAAWAVANNGKQVAILAPTTLLVQQHYQNFSDRFADWPIKIASISRFGGAKQQQETLSGLESGKIDIIIGTHKLLQKTVKFHNLGLIIIDEEHRFGVKHKEHLKSLRAEVDILTLTATPIPRTLNMSLSGIQDLSIIATPPVHRHSINTFITQWNEALIKEACQRELKRGGQVYFLHNEVKTIEKQANEIKKIIPEATVEFAHGQLPEKQLEKVMLDFYHQRFNILVCTTIIESGIDIPTANTIIINRADKLGLSQLHQIRGRVGRSHHRAYAYLIIPPESQLTPDAKKRLEAIESLEDLGIGFTLATHDLEIRGAGELLGENQSGQISEVGFSLYIELLEKAVESIRNGDVPNLEAPLNEGVEIDLGIPAVIPDDYVYDIHLRLILYKRIANAKTSEELDELKVEFIDRFGLLPQPLKNLFDVTQIKLEAQHAGIQKIDINDNGIRILFMKNPNIQTENLIELIQSNPSSYKFNGVDTLRISENMEEIADRSAMISALIHKLVMTKAA